MIATSRSVSHSSVFICSYANSAFIHLFDPFLQCHTTTSFCLPAPEIDRNEKPGRKKMISPPPARPAPAPVPVSNTEEGAVITSTLQH